MTPSPAKTFIACALLGVMVVSAILSIPAAILYALSGYKCRRAVSVLFKIMLVLYFMTALSYYMVE